MPENFEETRAQICQRREARERVKATHPELYPWLVELLARHDPLGLIDMGAPRDEYELEVATILPRLLDLQDNRTLTARTVQETVHTEFIEWFGERTAGPEGRYWEIAREIEGELRERRSRAPWALTA